MAKCIKCNEQADWLEIYCQEHWEQYCSEMWWEMIPKLQEQLTYEHNKNCA